MLSTKQKRNREWDSLLLCHLENKLMRWGKFHKTTNLTGWKIRFEKLFSSGNFFLLFVWCRVVSEKTCGRKCACLFDDACWGKSHQFVAIPANEQTWMFSKWTCFFPWFYKITTQLSFSKNQSECLKSKFILINDWFKIVLSIKVVWTFYLTLSSFIKRKKFCYHAQHKQIISRYGQDNLLNCFILLWLLLFSVFGSLLFSH